MRRRVGRLAEIDVAAVVGVVGLEPLAGQQVLGVPVAPGLAHRARVRAVDGADAVLVGDQAVGEPVRVLVPDRRGVVAEVVELRQRVEVLEQVELHRRRLAVGRRVHVRVVGVVAVRAALGVGVAPSNDCSSSGSSFWKLPDALSNPIVPPARWSWNLLTMKKASVADCLRLVCQLVRSPTGSHPQTWVGRQRGAPLTVNGVKSNRKSPLVGVTSSEACATLSSLTSDHVCAFGPVRLVAVAGSQPGVVSGWMRVGVPPCGAPM